MDAFDTKPKHGNVLSGSQQTNLPFVRSEAPEYVDLEPDTELACISPTSLKSNDPSFAVQDAHEDASSDSGGAAQNDFFKSTDVITSAAATWCVHETYEEPDADPLVSFFSQLVSSHTLLQDSSEKQAGQPHVLPDVDPPVTKEIHQSSPSAEFANSGNTNYAPCVLPTENPVESSEKAINDHGNGWTVVGDSAASEYHGYFASSNIDPNMREYLTASLKRDNFAHILGSIRSAISDNPHIFASRGAALESLQSSPVLPERVFAGQRFNEAEGFRQVAFPPQNTRSSATCRSNEVSLTAEALLPPPIPVNQEFCRANPRIAVSWLVHAQVTATLEALPTSSAQGRKDKLGAAIQRRLDPDTAAQIACLVPPTSLYTHASSNGATGAPVMNPSRDALKKATTMLVATLDAGSKQALIELLHSWYYSGFFTGQVFGNSKCTGK